MFMYVPRIPRCFWESGKRFLKENICVRISVPIPRKVSPVSRITVRVHQCLAPIQSRLFYTQRGWRNPFIITRKSLTLIIE